MANGNETNGKQNGKTAVDYVRISAQYIVYLILAVMFWMWQDLSHKQDVTAEKVQTMSVSLAVHQAASVKAERTEQAVEEMERRVTILETKIRQHRDRND